MNVFDFTETIYQYSDSPRPELAGSTGEKGPGINVVINIGTSQFTINADPVTGRYSWTPSEDLADGSYSVSIRTIDRAGNTSKPLLKTLVIETVPPEAPILLNLYDDQGPDVGSFDIGGKTDDRSPTLTGVARAGATVVLKNGDEVIGSAVANAEGIWQLTPDKELKLGNNSLTLETHDMFAGKARESAPSAPFNIIVVEYALPPGEAVIDYAFDDVGNVTGTLLSEAITDDQQPTLYGRAAPGSKVEIRYSKDGVNWVTEQVLLNKQEWNWEPKTKLEPGEWQFEVNAGNGWQSPFTLNLHDGSGSGSTNPLQPVVLFAEDDAGVATGLVSSGAIIDDSTPGLIGRGEANGKVTLSWGTKGAFIESVEVNIDAAGYWHFQIPTDLAPDTWHFRVQNVGSSSWSSEFVLNIILPDSHIPIIESVYDDVVQVIGEVQNGGYTNDDQPTLSGKGEALRTLFIYDGGVLLNSVQVDASGNWSFTADALSEKVHALSVSYGAWDANLATFSFTVDVTDPDTPDPFKILGISASDILALGQKEMFISNEKSQYMITGEKAALLDVDAIASEEWSVEGKVTIAGVQYQVFNHSAGETELLVQDNHNNPL